MVDEPEKYDGDLLLSAPYALIRAKMKATAKIPANIQCPIPTFIAIKLKALISTSRSGLK